MGPFEMVVAIVGISAVASVARAKYGHGRGGRLIQSRNRFFSSRGIGSFSPHDGRSDYGGELEHENRQLRDELAGLKQRIQVLERLATDDETDAARLDREIEKLRERPGLTPSAPNKE